MDRVEISDRAPAYRDPALYFDALRLVVALREGDRTEETLATETERNIMRVPAHVHLYIWGVILDLALT